MEGLGYWYMLHVICKYQSLTSFFQLVPLISFSYLVAVANTSSTVLSRYGESAHLVLFLILVNSLSFSLFNLLATALV